MEKDKLIYTLKFTVYISLIIQALTATFNVGILGLDAYDKDSFDDDVDVLIDLVWLGLFVQLIEGTFYIWLVSFINTVENITQYRYYDWFFSTPTMLIIFVVYLIYLREKEDTKKELEKRKMEKVKKVTFKEGKVHKDLIVYISENKMMLGLLLFLNVLMLFFGYLGETGVLSIPVSVLFGFVPFVVYFYLIYEYFAKFTELGTILFWVFSGIWSLYGFSALLPYYEKNISYNVLDIVSKNFFELFLGFKLLYLYF
jgi:hypothetical protein